MPVTLYSNVESVRLQVRECRHVAGRSKMRLTCARQFDELLGLQLVLERLTAYLGLILEGAQPCAEGRDDIKILSG